MLIWLPWKQRHPLDTRCVFSRHIKLINARSTNWQTVGNFKMTKHNYFITNIFFSMATEENQRWWVTFSEFYIYLKKYIFILTRCLNFKRFYPVIKPKSKRLWIKTVIFKVHIFFAHLFFCTYNGLLVRRVQNEVFYYHMFIHLGALIVF